MGCSSIKSVNAKEKAIQPRSNSPEKEINVSNVPAKPQPVPVKANSEENKFKTEAKPIEKKPPTEPSHFEIQPIKVQEELAPVENFLIKTSSQAPKPEVLEKKETIHSNEFYTGKFLESVFNSAKSKLLSIN